MLTEANGLNSYRPREIGVVPCHGVGSAPGLSLTEVFRRAGINGTTLFGAKHKHLHSDVTNWLKNFKAQSVTDHPRVRREITSRVADWEQRYKGLSDSHRKTELDLQESERKLRDVEDQIEVLTKQNVVLTQALNELPPVPRTHWMT